MLLRHAAAEKKHNGRSRTACFRTGFRNIFLKFCWCAENRIQVKIRKHARTHIPMDFSAAIFRLLTCRLEVAEVANIRWNLKLRQHQITNHSNATHNRKYKASIHPHKLYAQDQKHQKATMLMLSFIKRPQEVPRNRSNYVVAPSTAPSVTLLRIYDQLRL